MVGSTWPTFMGEMGRLPGLPMHMAARAVLAPVAEAPVEAARALNRRLLEGDGSHSVGEAYRKAIGDCPSVALLQIYGSCGLNPPGKGLRPSPVR